MSVLEVTAEEEKGLSAFYQDERYRETGRCTKKGILIFFKPVDREPSFGGLNEIILMAFDGFYKAIGVSEYVNGKFKFVDGVLAADVYVEPLADVVIRSFG
ncbi:hypothetical protein KY332_01890 [Candidatus Woesearchaeota archaeon]|nr:hypothetical protein [Candidatus Woesearchaeota archaeon]